MLHVSFLCERLGGSGSRSVDTYDVTYAPATAGIFAAKSQPRWATRGPARIRGYGVAGTSARAIIRAFHMCFTLNAFVANRPQRAQTNGSVKERVGEAFPRRRHPQRVLICPSVFFWSACVNFFDVPRRGASEKLRRSSGCRRVLQHESVADDGPLTPG
jgi:hypothetical protein